MKLNRIHTFNLNLIAGWENYCERTCCLRWRHVSVYCVWLHCEQKINNSTIWGLGVTTVGFGPSNILNGKFTISSQLRLFHSDQSQSFSHEFLIETEASAFPSSFAYQIVKMMREKKPSTLHRSVKKAEKKIEIWYKHFHHGIKINSLTPVAQLLAFDGPLDFRSFGGSASAAIKFPFQAQSVMAVRSFGRCFFYFVRSEICPYIRIASHRYANQDVSQAQTSCQLERKRKRVMRRKRWRIECHFACCQSRRRSGPFIRK